MPNLDNIRRPVAEEMKTFQKTFRGAIHSNVTLLNIISSYILHNKGKQMRPLFVFLTAKMTGTITDSTYTAATLIELMHTATLIHDDVVDESYERRGLFSMNAIWRSKLSVLMGDYFLARGLMLASRKRDHDLLDIVADAVNEMSEGELLQLQKSRKLNIDTASYYEVIRKKTATLIAACTASGAKSSGATQEEIDRVYQMGIDIGMAFQIKDDLFDYQPLGITGKPAGNDLKEKKFTLPLIYALEHSSRSKKRSILKLIRNGSMSNNKIFQVIDFVRAHDGLDFAEKKMYEFKKKAEDILNSFPESAARQSLLDLVTFTVERNK
ncbi:MAG: polyprenyl synthetase family protein [Bacteroidales bacterium]|nr:polyprenyl synthetase family protein [Bacteroidales bacterium]MDT8431165.1 polyprenyl synthetase family protein [Bacteroidales bacterium]